MMDAVLFDFDGVIVDTEPLHHRSFQQVLEPMGLPISWEDYQETYIGFDDRDALKTRFAAAGRPLPEADMADLIHRKARAFLELIDTEGAIPFPGLPGLIRLASQSLPTALCSGALRSDVDPIIRHLGLADCFHAVVTADRVARSKPDPESYRTAFAELAAAFPGRALDPGRSVALEDTPTGIRSAVGAGLAVIGVTNTYPPEALGEARAVVDSLEGMTLEDLARLAGVAD